MANPDPLHGITLKALLTDLVDEYGWEELGQRITIKCFTNDPSISSSLKFLRKTPWARTRVEALYIAKSRERQKLERQHTDNHRHPKTTGNTSIWPTSE